MSLQSRFHITVYTPSYLMLVWVIFGIDLGNQPITRQWYARLCRAGEQCLGALNAAEQELIRMRLGIGSGKPLGGMTLIQAADVLGMATREVARIEEMAVRKLRHPARSLALRRLLEDQGFIDV
jgi:DNA-directed RNA polymerase sigma subunit (sigma70/sigma32)